MKKMYKFNFIFYHLFYSLPDKTNILKTLLSGFVEWKKWDTDLI